MKAETGNVELDRYIAPSLCTVISLVVTERGQYAVLICKDAREQIFVCNDRDEAVRKYTANRRYCNRAMGLV